jgi:PAS domain S-box-containing protein
VAIKSGGTLEEHEQDKVGTIRERIYEAQVNYLYSNAAIGLLTTFVNSAVLAYLLWPRVWTGGLVIWLSLLWLFTLFRYGLILRHRRAVSLADYRPLYWGRWFIASMLIAGLLWGSIVLLAYPATELPYQIFVAFVLGGMAAGASSSLAALYSVPLLFNLAAVLPVIGRLLYDGGQIQSAMAIMSALFLAMMLVFARRSHNMFVSTVRLGLEKSRLLDEYARTRDDLLQEVSGRAQAEASLRDSQSRLRTIVEKAPLIIFATDTEGRFVLSEGKGLESLRVKPGELVGRNIEEVYAQTPAMIEALQRALRGEERTCRREVEGRLFDAICTPMRDANEQIIGVIGIETDVTEKMRVERIRRDLISTVSHELRTPLTSIIGALQLVHAGVLDEDVAKRNELLDNALRNSQRLIRLVNDILDIDKLESGKMTFDMQRLPLTALLEQAMDANHAYADSYGVGLDLCRDECDAHVSVDGERFLQVMNNLLSNAIKHSPRGKQVQIRAECLDHRFGRQDSRPLPAVRVEVVDNGPGIPEAARATIFEKFTQVAADNSPVQGGSGLGLSIARAIVERLDGDIGFEVDESRRETRFYIVLPRN